METLRILVFFSTFIWLCHEGFATTHVQVWDHARFKGAMVDLGDIEPYSHIYFTVFDNKISSYKLLTGSCVEIHKNCPPNYSSTASWFWSDEWEMSYVGSFFNDAISSVKACGTYNKTLECPSGTYVRDLVHLGESGVEIHCYSPKSTAPVAILRTNKVLTSTGACKSVVHGVKYYWDSRREIWTIVKECDRVENPPTTGLQYCYEGFAFSSLELMLENNSGYIKDFNIKCTAFPKIESSCTPKDKWNRLMVCDATSAQFPLKCSQQKTVGVGLNKMMTKEQRKEKEFYEELGFSVGTSGFGLSTNFQTNIGSRQTTSYSWSTSEETTFHVATTITVEVDAYPGCRTEIYEVIGECAFLQVKPNSFERRDYCNNQTVVRMFQRI